MEPAKDLKTGFANDLTPLHLTLIISAMALMFIGTITGAKSVSFVSVFTVFLSMVCYAVFFFMYQKNSPDNLYVNSYKQQPLLITAAKSVVFIFLLALALFFISKKVYELAFVACAGAVFQAIFIFKAGKTSVERGGEARIYLPVPRKTTAVMLGILLVLPVVIMVLISKAGPGYAFISLSLLMLAVVFYFNRIAPEVGPGDNEMSAVDYAVIGIILLNALFIRFFQLESVPPGYSYDARNIMWVVDEISQKKNLGIFMQAYDISSLYHYMCYYFVKTFGLGILGIRALTAVLSLASVLGLFLLIKEMFNKKIALLTAAIFAFLFLNVNFSRLDSPVYTAVFGVIFGMYFLLMGLKKGDLLYYALAGVMTAFSSYIYSPGKLQVIIIFFAFIIWGISVKKIKQSAPNFRGLLVLALAALASFLPMLAYIKAGFITYMQRANTYIIHGPGALEKYVTQINTWILSFTETGSNFAINNLPLRPILSGLEAVLFIAGFAYTLAYFRKKENAVLLVWFFISFVPGILFTSEAKPLYFRAITALPCIAVFMAVGAYSIYTLAAALLPKFSKYVYWAVLGIAAVYSLSVTANDYFVKYAANPEVGDYFRKTASGVERLLDENAGRGVKTIVSAFYKPTNKMFRLPKGKSNPVIVAGIPDLGLNGYYSPGGAFVVAEGMYLEYFEYLKEYFPLAVVNAVKNSEGASVDLDPAAAGIKYITLSIPAESIQALYGWSADYYAGGKIYKTEKITGPVGITEPTDKIILRGLIDMPAYKAVKFDFDSLPVTVYIDGAPYDGKAIAKGLHKFSAVLMPGKRDAVNIFWQLDGGKKETLPAANRIDSEKIYGLKSKISYNFNYDKAYALDPMVNYRLYKDEKPSVMTNAMQSDLFTLSWEGYYYAEADGEYAFELQTMKNSCSTIWFKQKEVYAQFGKNIKHLKIPLKKGWHPVLIVSYSAMMPYDEMVYVFKVRNMKEKEFMAVPYKCLSPYID